MTLHTIDDCTIDTGKIVGHTSLNMQPGRSYVWHTLSLYDDGVDLMAEAVRAIGLGKWLAAVPQPRHTLEAPRQNYHTFPTAEQLHALAQKNFPLVEPDEVLAIACRFGGDA